MQNKNKQIGLATLLLSAVLLSVPLKAQVTIGDQTAPNTNAVLDLRSNDKLGLLLPRLALQSTTLAAPLQAHVAGMVVYNTATAGDVTPGFYYDDGTKWVAVGSGSGSGITVEQDGVIGNEVTDVADATLVRTGSGTAADPYKLARAAITGDVSIPAASNAATINAIKGQTLPATAPTNGQTLVSNGAGAMTWQTMPGAVPGPVQGKLQWISTSGYTVNSEDYVIITTVPSGGCTVTLPDLTTADIGNTVIIFNDNTDNLPNNIVAPHIVGATTNNYSRAIMLIWSGSFWLTVSIS